MENNNSLGDIFERLTVLWEDMQTQPLFKEVLESGKLESETVPFKVGDIVAVSDVTTNKILKGLVMLGDDDNYIVGMERSSHTASFDVISLLDSYGEYEIIGLWEETE